MATTESIFHVDGHTHAGGFLTACFDTEAEALEFWGLILIGEMVM